MLCREMLCGAVFNGSVIINDAGYISRKISSVR